MKRLTILLYLAFSFFLNAQTIDYEKGVIIDSVRIKNFEQESFALYLPTIFNPNESSAIIFIFDPVARGKLGVQIFKESAEKFNYILVCSNNSRNGPYETNFNIANRLFEHVFSEFNIDNNRIYTAGFSGGSRLAASIAVLTNSIQGVIACGAGFSMNGNQSPHVENSFSYVGLIGDEDMNYQEMMSNKLVLSNLQIEHEIFTFNDNHKWPPKVQIERALSWLELQAYKRKIKPLNFELVKELYENQLAYSNHLQTENFYDGVLEKERIVRNFSTLLEIDSLSLKVQDLKTTKAYSEEEARRKEIEKEEYKISEKFLNRYRQESLLGSSENNFDWWRVELSKLDTILKSDDVNRLKMYKRIRYRLFAMAIENSDTFLRNGDLKHAIYCDRLLVLMFPKNPIWYYRLANRYASLNNLNQTLNYLKKSVKLGLKNKSEIHDNPVFLKFRTKKKFIRFLETL